MKKQVIIIVCVVAAVALLIVGYLIFQNRKNSRNNNSESGSTVFQLPEGFVWEGSYIDSVNGYAVLTIEKSADKYLCSIAVPSSDISYVESYIFEAGKSKDGNRLEYENGVHTSYLIPETDSNEQVTTNEIYTDGSGEIYYYNGYIIWIDDKDSAGKGFLFTPQDLGTLSEAS